MILSKGFVYRLGVGIKDAGERIGRHCGWLGWSIKQVGLVVRECVMRNGVGAT
jgi:hypothetical protein